MFIICLVGAFFRNYILYNFGYVKILDIEIGIINFLRHVPAHFKHQLMRTVSYKLSASNPRELYNAIPL